MPSISRSQETKKIKFAEVVIVIKEAYTILYFVKLCCKEGVIKGSCLPSHRILLKSQVRQNI